MNVVVSKTALKNFYQIVDYLIQEWGESVGIQFERRTNNFLNLLADFPEIGLEVNSETKYALSNLLNRQEFIIALNVE